MAPFSGGDIGSRLPDEAAIAEPTASGDWNLAWSDEFAGGSIDTNNWTVGEWSWGPGTTNGNSYADAEHCYIHETEDWLVLDTTFEGSSRGDNTYDSGCGGDDYWDEHAVGAMHSSDKVTFGYDSHDVIMARIRPMDLPECNSAWWSKADHSDTAWPPEIDMLEVMSDRPDESSLNIHYDPDGDCDTGTSSTDNGSYTHNNWVSDDFHLYEFRWEPGTELSYYIDGSHVRTVTDQTVIDAMEACNEPHHMIFNVLVEANWSPGDDCTKPSSAFPPHTDRGQVPHGDNWDNHKTQMEVDFVAKWTHN